MNVHCNSNSSISSKLYWWGAHPIENRTTKQIHCRDRQLISHGVSLGNNESKRVQTELNARCTTIQDFSNRSCTDICDMGTTHAPDHGESGRSAADDDYGCWASLLTLLREYDATPTATIHHHPDTCLLTSITPYILGFSTHPYGKKCL